MDNIEKLKEKVEKDPSSKLFVPLAEEYRKAGQTDKAIEVLNEGLQRQPGYMSARVSLGKIYLEKDMRREAKEEFEKVISAIPDNLFARRKLADIYRALGERDKAIEQYRTVLRLNPFDEEAVAIQRELEGATGPTPAAPTVAEETQPAQAESPWEAFKEEELLSVEEPIDAGTEVVYESEAIDEAEVFDIEALDELVAELGGEPPAEVAEEATREAPAIEPDEALFEEFAEKEPVLDVQGDIFGADGLVAQGQYLAAMSAYRTVLLQEPENKQVMQRVVELKALLKMLGREDDIFEANLQSFLEGIKRRRDEFSGSA